RFQNPEICQLTVELVDIVDLCPQIVDGHAARDFEALGVIRYPDIFIAALSRGSRHLLDRMRAVARCGMRMKLAPYVFDRNQAGQGASGSESDLVIPFAQLGLDKRQAELSIKTCFARPWPGRP